MQTRSLDEARLLIAWRKAPAIAKSCAMGILSYDERHAADHKPAGETVKPLGEIVEMEGVTRT